MIESIPYDLDVVPYLLVGLCVAFLGAGRLHASDRWWCPELAWFWWPIRRLLLPPLDVVLERVPGAYAKTGVNANEIVATDMDITHEEYLEGVSWASYEAQPLASIARLTADVDVAGAGELERSSVARYAGPKLFGLEWLPDWLRKYQIHRRAFGPDGSITDTAHWEYNPWNPLYALPHLFGIGLDVERGVGAARTDLEVELARGGNDEP